MTHLPQISCKFHVGAKLIFLNMNSIMNYISEHYAVTTSEDSIYIIFFDETDESTESQLFDLFSSIHDDISLEKEPKLLLTKIADIKKYSDRAKTCAYIKMDFKTNMYSLNFQRSYTHIISIIDIAFIGRYMKILDLHPFDYLNKSFAHRYQYVDGYIYASWKDSLIIEFDNVRQLHQFKQDMKDICDADFISIYKWKQHKLLSLTFMKYKDIVTDKCRVVVDPILGELVIHKLINKLTIDDINCEICDEPTLITCENCHHSICEECLCQCNFIDRCPFCKHEFDLFQIKVHYIDLFDKMAEERYKQEIKLMKVYFNKGNQLYNYYQHTSSIIDHLCKITASPVNYEKNLESLRRVVDLIVKGVEFNHLRTNIVINETDEVRNEINRVEQYLQKYNELDEDLMRFYEEIKYKIRSYTDANRFVVSIIPLLKTIYKDNNYTRVVSQCKCGGVIKDTGKFICDTCGKIYCNICCEELESNHKCRPEDIENWKYQLTNSTACPNCGIRIEKSSGCNDMWCTHCKHGFDYLTGERKLGAFHNPERTDLENNSVFDFAVNMDREVRDDIISQSISNYRVFERLRQCSLLMDKFNYYLYNYIKTGNKLSLRHYVNELKRDELARAFIIKYGQLNDSKLIGDMEEECRRIQWFE